MKKMTLIGGLLLSVFTMSAQETILFQETFETHPLTTFSNNEAPTQIPLGASPCGSPSLGVTSDYNSSNVSFGTDNTTRFLGVNPESPCGGFYDITASSNQVIDISTATEPLKFRCRYYQTSTLNFGAHFLTVTITSDTGSIQIAAEFDTSDAWTDLEVVLPATISGNITNIALRLGGGEAVALDDIEIFYGTTLSLNDFEQASEWSMYPNPATDQFSVTSQLTEGVITIYSMTGQKVLEQPKSDAPIHIAALSKGIYLVKISNEEHSFTKKLV